MEKKCSRCGKLFNPDDKYIRSVDTDENPLRIDLCSMCELDNAVEEIMKLKHFSRKEAEKYIFDTMNEALGNITLNKSLSQVTKLKKQGFKYVGDVESNKVVRMVDNNE